VTEANLTGSVLLGRERNKLIKARFSKFIAENDIDTWHRFFLKVLNHGEKQICTLMLIRGDGSVFPARLECIRIANIRDGTTTVRVALNDISDIKESEDSLRESEEKYRGLFAAESDGIFVIDRETGTIVDCNDQITPLYGYQKDELIGRPKTTISAEPDATRTSTKEGTEYIPIRYHKRKDGSVFPVEITANIVAIQGRDVIITAVRDITERKRAEAFRQLSADVLGILNEPAELEEVGRRVLDAIKRVTNADAVGIRLKSGDDFPYFVQIGFSRDFFLKENSLVMGDKEGGLCRDSEGNVSLECTCGLVISGKTDPGNPLFTPGGSAWLNNSFPLLELPETDDPRLHPRNTCIHMGYASVAISPIRISPEQIVGTLQINAFRKNCFTPDIIQSLELIAGQIGEALMRKQVEEALRQTLAEKEILLSEIHHRVKNNLTAFISLLSLEGSYEESPSGLALKKDLQNRARTMALIHETLYKTRQYAEVDMEIYLSTLVDQVVNSYSLAQSITTVIEVKGVTLDLSRATPTGLIINELVTNSLKYAFPPDIIAALNGRKEPCTIGIRMAKEDGSYLLKVFDNGVGLPAGFDPRTGKSLGLKLVNFLARHQLRAKPEVNTGKGTEFVFRFKEQDRGK
jgi:PAS domain S-box-containing protein